MNCILACIPDISIALLSSVGLLTRGKGNTAVPQDNKKEGSQ